MTLTERNTEHLDAVEWPPECLERVDSCPACGCTERELLYADLTDLIFRCAPGRWKMHKCAYCGTAYLDPRPTENSIHIAYQSYYTHSNSNTKKRGKPDLLRRLILPLTNGYINRRYNATLRPSNPLGYYLLYGFPRYRRVRDRLVRHLPPHAPGKRLLDVGCGSGEFMQLARRMGWSVTGIDTDPKAVANALSFGLDVRKGDLGSTELEHSAYDIISMNHVIEHVHDPAKVLSQAFRLLKAGGCLYIETPNIDSYGHAQFQKHWRGLEPPRHLIIFNWHSITQLLEDNGFEIIKKIRIPTPYVNLARKSRALSLGEDPYTFRAFSLIDRLRAMQASLRSYFSLTKTEHITLYARKPF